jgi:hypothetical protein
MKHCIICGVKDGETRENLGGNGFPGKIHISTYKLPHGEIYLCYNSTCQKILTLLINDFQTPMVWVTKEDLYEERFNENCLTQEEAENLTPEEMIEITSDAADLLSNGSFPEEYREVLNDTADPWRKEKERKLIETTPLKELPLLIEDLKYDSNKSLLEMRLKEGKNDK